MTPLTYCSWNNENRLSSATDGTLTIDFTYDYQGRLVKKDDGTDIEVYVYDGWNRIATFEVLPSTFLLPFSGVWISAARCKVPVE